MSVMLKNIVFADKPDGEELKERLKSAKKKLSEQQTLLAEHKIPVLVLVEGWGTAGKGSAIGEIIQNIDPRFFKVASMDRPTREERRKPFLCRYFTKLPEAGKFMLLDSGWMDEVTGLCLLGKWTKRNMSGGSAVSEGSRDSSRTTVIC